MSVGSKPELPRVFIGKFKWATIGTAAPVFPGWEFDILDHVGDEDKPDAVWHRERARGILRSHPEIKQLMGHYPLTAVWCLAAAAAQVGLAMFAAHLPWWGVLATAYFVGALINIMLFQPWLQALSANRVALRLAGKPAHLQCGPACRASRYYGHSLVPASQASSAGAGILRRPGCHSLVHAVGLAICLRQFAEL
jgi:hypothetical protein